MWTEDAAGDSYLPIEMGGKPPGSPTPDEIVDVDGPTIRRLRDGSGNPGSMPDEFYAHIPRVLQVVTAARAALMLARMQVTAGSLFGAPALAIVGKHFRVNQTGDPAYAISQIDNIFLMMQRAIGHVPEGVTLALDLPVESRVGGKSYMMAFGNGSSYRGRGDMERGLNYGSMYTCPRSRVLNQDAFVYAMIHELAHYVGPSDPQEITDHAYFHIAPGKYRTLNAEQCYYNAEVTGMKDFNVRANATG